MNRNVRRWAASAEAIIDSPAGSQRADRNRTPSCRREVSKKTSQPPDGLIWQPMPVKHVVRLPGSAPPVHSGNAGRYRLWHAHIQLLPLPLNSPGEVWGTTIWSYWAPGSWARCRGSRHASAAARSGSDAGAYAAGSQLRRVVSPNPHLSRPNRNSDSGLLEEHSVALVPDLREETARSE